eukprot:CAMPEP_0170465430 /NCGR_PEP_ID=MMETSP0123-20130129/9777_1 /TAXON_ID=182087 /ORGANISM="Favella ehrenbergii, Strain Fehren 1" /LENGTH=69 /DNA_ID=CAMNT_0010731325 /DNA_START=69 /DNA_END=278 /DNA_ORIENTATION=-
MSDGTLFLVSEFLVFSVASGQSLPREVALAHFLGERGQVAIEGLPAAAALLLADVVRVGPAGNHEATKE